MLSKLVLKPLLHSNLAMVKSITNTGVSPTINKVKVNPH